MTPRLGCLFFGQLHVAIPALEEITGQAQFATVQKAMRPSQNGSRNLGLGRSR
ncbi:hypothetical protein [Vacuolonema iberomarrocanum]|uniref:hypothetical protein n=1 Tax=Vacuolonema iberomarrocanum TaxID=3454632 RepID=UPI0019EA3B53|nr:hypothetical protein [filamentous cyanobacterium LEGE 07170]